MVWKEKKELTKEVIRVLRPVPHDEKRGTELAVIRWIEGSSRAFAPQLVNQEVYLDTIDRKRKYGKVKGMKWGDFKFLTETPERVEEILSLLADLHTPKKTERRSGQDAAANDNVPSEEQAPPRREESGFDADGEVPF